MYKKTTYILFLSIIIIFNGCIKNSNNNDIHHFKKFPKIIEADSGKVIDIEILSSMVYIYSLKHFLILKDVYATQNGIYILRKKDLSLIKVTGQIGMGPNEIGRPGPLYVVEKDNSFYYTDFGKYKVWRYSLDSLLSDDNYMPKEAFKFKSIPNMYPLDLVILKDTLYFPASNAYYMVKLFDNHSYQFIANKKSEIINVDIPELKKEAYITRMTNNYDQSKFAFAFQNSDILTFTDYKFSPQHHTIGPKQFINKKIKGSRYVYYLILKSDNDFVYAGYVNKPFFETDQYGKHKANYPNSIRVFSWEGKPVVEIKLPHPFCGFYVDRINGRIIVYHTNKEKPLCSYKINPDVLFK